MRRIGQIAFVTGFIATIGICIFLNARSYNAGIADYYGSIASRISHTGFYWGFPLPWLYEGTCFPCDDDSRITFVGFWLNVAICALSAVGAGYALKMIAGKLTESSRFSLLRQRSFLAGVLITMLYFIFMNLSGTNLSGTEKICFDCYETYGFPFVMHESGTILHLDQYVWSGVVANLTAAILSSVIVGLICRFSWNWINRSSSLR